MSDESDTVPEELGGRRRMTRGRVIGLVAALIVLGTAVVFILIPIVSGIIAANPTTYSSQPFGFSARFPAQPTVPVPPAKAKGALLVRWTHDDKSFSVRATPLKGSVPAANSDDTIVTALQAGSKTLGGTIVQPVSPTTLDGKSAFDVVFTSGKDRFTEIGAIHHDRFYLLILLNPTTTEAQQFRDSFVFLD